MPIKQPDQKRRKLLATLTGLALAPTAMAGLTPTPRQSAGPFYPTEIPLDDDNNLTQVAGRNATASGQLSDISGRIVDINGRPLPGMRIEIWQCDANGRYRHPRENGRAPIDPNFQGHGHTISNADGQYLFRTIRPVAYPGRTPHIHVAVFPGGEPPFVTQFYVQGEAGNADDFLYQRIPVEKRGLVTARFIALENNAGNELLQASYDIILDRADGTPIA